MIFTYNATAKWNDAWVVNCRDKSGNCNFLLIVSVNYKTIKGN